MIETVTIAGLTVAVARPVQHAPPHEAPAGPRPALLLVHGILGGAWYWAKYQHFFAERGYASYAPNLRGRAGSRPVADLGRVSLADYVEDALGVAAALGAPPVVLGHSMGGLIAQKLAEAAAVRAAVLLNSAPPRGIPITGLALIRRQLKHAGAILRSRPLVATPADNDVLTLNRVPAEERPALNARFVPDSGRVARELSLGAVAVDARRVRCPVLSVSAADDQFVAPAIGRRIARKYGAPYRLFDGHAHFLPWEPGWEGPAAEIERWLSAVLDGRAAEAPLGAATGR